MNNIFAVAGIVIKELYRRKDFYVLFILTIVICLVMASVNIFNDNQIIRYLKELCLLLIWISSLVIAITTTARQIPAEREQRTLLPLLAKPLSRSQLIFGKFLGCWVACGLVLICFYVFFGALAASREHAWPLLNYFQAAFLHWVMLGVVIALTLLGSLVFAAPSSNSTICFVIVVAILSVGRYLDTVALSLAEPSRSIIDSLYFAMPHLEWAFGMRNLIVHDWPLIGWKFFGLEHSLLAGLRGDFSCRRLPGVPPQSRQLKMNSPRTFFLLLIALLVFCFGLAADLAPQFQALENSRRQSNNFFSLLLGDSSRIFANSFFVKADAYYHSGYYPTIFDNNEAFKTPHMAEDTGAVASHNQGEEKVFWDRRATGLTPLAAISFPTATRIWMKAARRMT